MTAYIAAMMESALQRASTSISVARISRGGHIPIAFNDVVSRAAGMIIVAIGIAIRLVSMKYCGNVPK